MTNNHPPAESWEEEKWYKQFLQTKLIKWGGMAFECSNYEDIVVDMESFISSQITQAKREMIEEFRRLLKTETLVSGIAHSNFYNRNWIDKDGLLAFLQKLAEQLPIKNKNGKQ